MTSRFLTFFGAGSLVVGITIAPQPAFTQSLCPGGAVSPAEVLSVEGAVSLLRADGTATTPKAGLALCPGDSVATGEASAIDLRFGAKRSITNILSSSTVVITRGEDADIALQGGLMRFISSVRGVFTVRTPQTDAGIDGTEAMLAVSGADLDTLVLVREGIVRVSDRRGGKSFSLAAGDASYSSEKTTLTEASADNVPAKFRNYVLNPNGAADWAVYYPPILLGSGADAQVSRAAALLDAGQPDEAEALLRAYTGTDQASALALRSLAAVFRNRAEDGADLAFQAVQTDASSGPAYVSQSYALQALGDIRGARDAAIRATENAPRDAFAWARRAELALTDGETNDGRAAANRSLELAKTSLGYAVLGFADLADRDRDSAEIAFRRAIELDTQAPLPRLGLGLARIAGGDLDAGRAEIETAAAFDPQRAQLRTWLGRAYLEEGLGEKAAAQFELAQQQDPDDPTGWLFSAQQKFAANDPVGALGDLQQAEATGEGRATLRGRAGLGEDQAVRETAAGRIFDVLGFDQQATQAGAAAVDADPTNPGAHRFLADTYRARPGFEIAQTSERLVAQLLSPPSKNPVQPRLNEPDLALLNTTGSTRVTFHEFSPLFDGDGLYFIGSGAVGNNGTFEDEISFSVLEGGFSFSAGQFHSSTDGQRENDDVRHDVIALEGKAQLSPKLTLTVEARVRETDEGDRFLRAFANPITTRNQVETKRAQLTLGGHYKVASDNDLLFFGVIAKEDRSELVRTTDATVIPPVSFDTTFEEEAHTSGVEIQDIQRFDWGHLIFGGAYSNVNADGLFIGSTVPEQFTDTSQQSGYAYAFLRPVDWAELTLGLSVDRSKLTESNPGFNFATFDSDGPFVSATRDFTQFNPKVGLRLEPLDGVILRGAYARTLKRELVQDRTLEPTTIAGFNQFYDDFSQTDAQTLGAGFDIEISDNLWVGAEYVYRDLQTPEFDIDPVTFNNTATVTRKGTNNAARAYANITFGEHWSGSLGVEFSRGETDLIDRPDSVETLLVPVSLSYFDPSGFFASGEAIFVDQTSTGQNGTQDGLLSINTDEQGVVVNAAFGYRLPNSRGIIALELNNILDQALTLQNTSNNSARPTTRPVAEGFSVLGRVTFGF